MLWLMVLVLVGGLCFVLFNKREIKTMGVGYVPPEQRKPAPPPSDPPTA